MQCPTLVMAARQVDCPCTLLAERSIGWLCYSSDGEKGIETVLMEGVRLESFICGVWWVYVVRGCSV